MILGGKFFEEQVMPLTAKRGFLKFKSIIIALLFIIFFLNSTFLFSQVTLSEIKQSTEKIVIKPPPFDSLKNWEAESISDLKKYVGQQIYLPPISIRKNSDRYSDLNDFFLFSIRPSKIEKILTYVYKPLKGRITDSSTVCNNYFTILKLIYDQNLKSLLLKMDSTSSNLFQDFGYERKDLGAASLVDFLYLIRNDSTGDSLYCSDMGNFILVPYFIKQKQLFEEKNLIYDDYKNYFDSGNSDREEYDLRYNVENIDHNEEIITTGKKVIIKPGSKWYCKEVTLLKPLYKINYILGNEKGEQVALTNLNGFILKKDYIKRQSDKKLQQQQLIAQRKKEELLKKEAEKKAYDKRKIECLRLFGQEYGELIAKSKVQIGMSSEMCKYSWGNPIWTNKTTAENITCIIWYYSLGQSLSFINDKLKMIEE